MRFRFCDDLGADGFGWIAEERLTRTAHALAAEGKVWLVDALDWPEAVERARALGEPAGVVQLLDRHGRDCAALAARLEVPHLVVPGAVPGSPFLCLRVRRSRVWREAALWWPGARTLVVAEALGTNAFFTGRLGPVGVHPLLRLTPPRALAGLEVERLLVGHGEGVLEDAATAVRRALERSRRDLPRLLLRLPLAARRGA